MSLSSRQVVCYFTLVLIQFTFNQPGNSNNQSTSLLVEAHQDAKVGDLSAYRDKTAQQQGANGPQQSSQLIFPQQNPKSPLILSRNSMWFVSTTASPLQEPVNIPTVINQADAQYLEQYLRNYFAGTDNTNQAPLNLGSNNDRAARTEPRIQSLQVERADYGQKTNLVGAGNTYTNHQRETSLQHRSDPTQNRYDAGAVHFKKGMVEDVKLNKAYPLAAFKQMAEHASHKPLMLDSWKQNCITRSERASSVCEDHLIKRLSQDATEGRTVRDVGRRVCCALFFHRDCIDSVVLKHCPDSSPTAADYLLGSRRLDLSLSCLQFNKDGCNSSNMVRTSPYVLIAITMFSVILIMMFIY